jgi:hypothetical protein
MYLPTLRQTQRALRQGAKGAYIVSLIIGRVKKVRQVVVDVAVF